tara:strand:- start:5261 stop:5410 length:150 start_codon:yes stop_codon:yes gene_type:complete
MENLKDILESKEFMNLFGNEVEKEMKELKKQGWNYNEIQSIAKIITKNK